MNDKQIEQLVAAFYEGSASDAQLRALDDFFRGGRPVPARWRAEGECYRAITEASQIPLPAGLSARLEQAVGSRTRKRRLLLKPSIRWAAAAAVVLLCVGIATYRGGGRGSWRPADTFTDPQEAARVAQETLVFVAEKLNSGLDRVAYAGGQIEKANKVLYKRANKKQK